MPPHRQNLLSCVLVAFRSGGCLPQALQALRESLRGVAHEIIVVNNSSIDTAEIDRICRDHGARFLQAARNLGYGAGCNYGAGHAVGQRLLFLNPDVTATPAAMNALLATLEGNRGVVAAGPLFISPRGRVRARFVCLKSPFLGAKSFRRGRRVPKRPIRTEFLSGGALLVRRDAFQAVQGFDENIFLFHEDDDLCLRLRPFGALRYAGHSVFRHDFGHSSPPNLDLARVRAWHLGYSKIYVARKHHRPAVVGLTLLEGLLKLASPQALWSRPRRIKAVYFLRGVLAGLLSGPQMGEQTVLPVSSV